MTNIDPLSTSARVIKENWLATIRHTRSQAQDKVSLGAVGAAPHNYINAYTLEGWQKLFFPLIAIRVQRFKNKFLGIAPLSEPSLWLAENALASLEFRDQIASPSLRMHVRQKIILEQLPAWDVRQAFNSLALKKIDQAIGIRAQPHGCYLVCTSLLWLFSATTLIFFGQAGIDAVEPKLEQIEVGWLFLKLQLSILLVFVMHRLGPQWKNGVTVLRKMGFKEHALP